MSNYSSTFLLPEASFAIWAWSVFNLAWNYLEFNNSESPNEADRKAIQNDFGMVWSDLLVGIENFRKEENENAKK